MPEENSTQSSSHGGGSRAPSSSQMSRPGAFQQIVIEGSETQLAELRNVSRMYAAALASRSPNASEIGQTCWLGTDIEAACANAARWQSVANDLDEFKVTRKDQQSLVASLGRARIIKGRNTKEEEWNYSDPDDLYTLTIDTGLSANTGSPRRVLTLFGYPSIQTLFRSNPPRGGGCSGTTIAEDLLPAVSTSLWATVIDGYGLDLSTPPEHLKHIINHHDYGVPQSIRKAFNESRKAAANPSVEDKLVVSPNAAVSSSSPDLCSSDNDSPPGAQRRSAQHTGIGTQAETESAHASGTSGVEREH